MWYRKKRTVPEEWYTNTTGSSYVNLKWVWTLHHVCITTNGTLLKRRDALSVVCLSVLQVKVRAGQNSFIPFHVVLTNPIPRPHPYPKILHSSSTRIFSSSQQLKQVLWKLHSKVSPITQHGKCQMSKHLKF